MTNASKEVLNSHLPTDQLLMFDILTIIGKLLKNLDY